MSNGKDNNTTISTQVISASLTMITVIGAFAVFIIEKRVIGFWYYLIAGLAFLSFVVSIFLGGKGLSGKGVDKAPNPYFNWQAIIALIGIILFCVSVFLGKEKPDDLEKKVNEQDKIIIELRTKDEFRAKEMRRLSDDIHKLTKQIDELNKATVPISTLPKAWQNQLKK
jgi:ABC-type antimicrobial peptide transport system permease subunit